MNEEISTEDSDADAFEVIHYELKSLGPPRPAPHDVTAPLALGWIHMPILALLATAVVIRSIVGWPGGFAR